MTIKQIAAEFKPKHTYVKTFYANIYKVMF